MGSALNTLFWLERSIFCGENNRNKLQTKWQKNLQKKFFHFIYTNVYKNSILLFHFFVIWLSVKCKDFLIISNLSRIVHVFILFCKDKLEVQHKSATFLLWVYVYVSMCVYIYMYICVSIIIKTCDKQTKKKQTRKLFIVVGGWTWPVLLKSPKHSLWSSNNEP